MKTWFQHKSLPGYDKQKIITYGNSCLCKNCIHRGTIEGFNMKVLFSPFEKQFNLPSFPIQIGDCECLQLEVVRQESIYDTSAEIFIHDEPESVGVLAGGFYSCQSYRLIRNQASIRVNFPTAQYLIHHVVFCPGDKVGIFEMKVLVKCIKLHISFVHQVVRVRLDGDFVHDLRIVNTTVSKTDECRNRASEIHQRMHFERTFTMMESGPRAKLETQFNGAAVKGINHLLKIDTKLLVGIKFLCFPYQNLCKVLINTPILLLVHFCKRGPGHCLESRSVEVLSAEVKGCFNVSQTGTVCELCKAHHHELITAFELYRVFVALVVVDTLLKLIFINKRHNLCKDCFSFIHSLQNVAQMPIHKTMISNRKIISAS